MRATWYIKSILLPVLILSLAGRVPSFSQEKNAKNHKVVFHLNNLEDKQPDIIKIHTPLVGQDARYVTDKAQVHLIGEVLDTTNLKFVSVNNKMVSLNEHGLFTSDLVLQAGENEIEFVTIAMDETIRDQILTIDFTPIELTLEDRIVAESNYYALIIGINEYEDESIMDLDHPIRDAENLYLTLTEHYTFNQFNTRLLKNPGRVAIIDELDRLSEVVTPNDNVLIFYAGHGSYEPKGEIGFWWPSDARRESKAGWLRNSAIVDYLKGIDSKHTLLISDACFSGSIFKSRSVSMETDNAFERIYNQRSRKAMTSGAKTEVPDKSEFIKYLINRLEDNEETYLPANMLYTSIYIAVASNTITIPQYGDIQGVDNEGGEFIFLRRK